MTYRLLPALLITTGLFVASCGGDSESPKEEGSTTETSGKDSTGMEDELDLETMTHLDMNKYELDLTFFVPKFANLETGEVKEPWVEHSLGEMEWTVAMGRDFKLSLERFDESAEEVMAYVKGQLDRNAAIFNYEYMKEEPNIIVLRRGLKNRGDGVDHASYHMYAVHDTGNTRVLFSTPQDGLPLVVVRQLMHSYRTIGMDPLPETYIPES